MEATKEHAAWEQGTLHASLESILKMYETSLGGKSEGVPDVILQSATQIPSDQASTTMQGPADCTPNKEDEDNNAPDDKPVEPESAAVINGGIDDIGPAQLWDAVMRNYKVAQACEQELSALDNKKEKTKQDEIKQRHAKALAEAVTGIAKLSHKDVHKKLSEWAARETGSRPTVTIGHSAQLKSSRDPTFWYACFVRLFPRGDCQENTRERTTVLSHEKWAKCLLTRADCPLWRKT